MKMSDKLKRWENAPEWANWLAVDDSSGNAFWYLDKPNYDEDFEVFEPENEWYIPADRELEIAGSAPNGLEERPKVD